MTGELITAIHQVQWRGLLWGWPATDVTLTNLAGWLDRPPARTNNIDRPGRHGMLLGAQRLSGRLVEVQLEGSTRDPGWLSALRDAMVPGDDPGEEPLVIWDGTDTPQMVNARVERDAIPTDLAWSVGYNRAVIQWMATDYRRYGVSLLTASTGLPVVSSTGLKFPLQFPLQFGGATTGGQMSLVNSGNTSTSPVWTLTGPITGPIILNTGTGRKLLIDPAYTLPAGSHMVLDTGERTITVNGVNRRDLLLTANWFDLPTGTTTVTLTSAGGYDPGAQLSASWRDAYL